MNFGALLKEARKNKEMSQDDLAKLLGVNRVSISNYEKNKNTPTLSNLNKIKKILNLSSDYFDEKKTIVKTIPLIGKASCGIPNKFYNDDIEHIPVSDNIARDGVYAITAEGDSMLPKIKNGDIIICDKEMLCENGNIVHYTTIDGDSGIKKFSCNPITEQVTLMPLNTDYEPIILHREDVKCARCFKIMSDL